MVYFLYVFVFFFFFFFLFLFFLFFFVFFVFFVNNVKFVYVEHFHLWSLNMFCNLLLENIFQVKCLTVYEGTSLQ